MRDDEFEWDDRKARSNLRKHGIDFVDARYVFMDDDRIDGIDDSMDYGEDRSLAIGLVNGRVLAVVYTIRGDRIRIISARKADRHEEQEYFERD